MIEVKYAYPVLVVVLLPQMSKHKLKMQTITLMLMPQDPNHVL